MANTHRKKTPSIALIHSETRSYRVPLWERLNKAYNIHFYFMYGAGWSKHHPEHKHWKYTDMKRFPSIGYSSDFSPGIMREMLKGYDIVIASGLASFGTHATFPLLKLLGKKVILWDETWEWPRTTPAKIAKPYAKYIVKHSDALIAAGSKAKEFYESFGAQHKDIFIANNCAADLRPKVSKTKVEQLRKKYKLGGKQVILYLGRIIKYKGLDYLIKAFKDIERKNKNAFLLIAGPDAGWQEHCEDLAKESGLKNYKFIGEAPHADVQNYYALANVFVLPTRTLYEDNVVNESWGLSVNEAMSLGVPVVATTAVAAAYDMLDGKTGIMVKEQDISALHKAIEKVLKTPPKKEHVRKAFERWNNYDKMFTAFKKAIQHVK